MSGQLNLFVEGLQVRRFADPSVREKALSWLDLVESGTSLGTSIGDQHRREDVVRAAGEPVHQARHTNLTGEDKLNLKAKKIIHYHVLFIIFCHIF